MPWYVLHVAAGTEPRVEAEIKRVAKDLEPGALKAYCPKERKIQVSRTGRRTIKREIRPPVLPGYVFVRVEHDAGFHAAKEIPGAIGFLGQKGRERPPKCPPSEVVRFRVAVAAGLYDKTKPKAPALEKGQQVRICRGPWTGFKAKYLSDLPRERIKVLLQAMTRGGAEHEMKLDLEDVEAAA